MINSAELLRPLAMLERDGDGNGRVGRMIVPLVLYGYVIALIEGRWLKVPRLIREG